MRTMILLAAALAAEPVFASDEEILRLYEESGSAWSQGRIDAADAAGEAAWRMAEEEWGPSEDTALLAEGLTQQRLMTGRREAAREPAARLAALASEGLAPGVHPAQAGLYVALAGFEPAAPDEQATRALEAALIAAESADIPIGPYHWMGWLDVTRGHVAAETWESAYAAGQNVMVVMDLATAVPDSARLEAALLAGNAAVETRDYVEAQTAIEWALEYIPSFTMVDGERVVSPAWAQLATWASLLESANYSSGRNMRPTDDLFGLDEMDAEGACPGFRWTRREAPVFPSRAAERGYNGAAIVEYEITAEGRGMRPYVIHEEPANLGFGSAALAALAGWEADHKTVGSCAGRRVITLFEFRLAQ